MKDWKHHDNKDKKHGKNHQMKDKKKQSWKNNELESSRENHQPTFAPPVYENKNHDKNWKFSGKPGPQISSKYYNN